MSQQALIMQGQFQWAMAGRSADKLEKLRADLAEIDPAVMDVPILTADLNDNKSLDKMVKQSDVLVSVAGPFWKLGYPLVRVLLIVCSNGHVLGCLFSKTHHFESLDTQRICAVSHHCQGLSTTSAAVT